MNTVFAQWSREQLPEHICLRNVSQNRYNVAKSIRYSVTFRTWKSKNVFCMINCDGLETGAQIMFFTKVTVAAGNTPDQTRPDQGGGHKLFHVKDP